MMLMQLVALKTTDQSVRKETPDSITTVRVDVSKMTGTISVFSKNTQVETTTQYDLKVESERKEFLGALRNNGLGDFAARVEKELARLVGEQARSNRLPQSQVDLNFLTAFFMKPVKDNTEIKDKNREEFNYFA